MLNTKPEHHEMHLEKTHQSGVQEWSCPSCGRRFLLQHHALYRRVEINVLEVGNKFATHSGSKGGLSISKPAVNNFNQNNLSA